MPAMRSGARTLRCQRTARSVRSVAITVAVAVSGPLAKEVGKVVGVGESAVKVWDIAVIPMILVAVSFMFAFLYKAAPNVKQPGFTFVSPGGVVALVIWIIASLLFALYVATLASYNKTCGSLGGVIAFSVAWRVKRSAPIANVSSRSPSPARLIPLHGNLGPAFKVRLTDLHRSNADGRSAPLLGRPDRRRQVYMQRCRGPRYGADA